MKWEYRVKFIERGAILAALAGGGYKLNDHEDLLQKAGEKGWELVQVLMVDNGVAMYFKRPKLCQ